MLFIGTLLFVLLAYLVGSVPWSVVLGKLFAGIDVRSLGSGGTGATNSLRILGWRYSAGVLALDFSKGLLPVLLARLIDLPNWAVAATAVATVAGHCWSPYIRFQGGKGMATGGGAAIALLPWIALSAVAIVVVVALTRYVSLGSLTLATVGSAFALVCAGFDVIPWSWAIAIVLMAAIIFIQHRGNIDRLLHGTERKFGNRERANAPTG